jgi:hypothetical protein
MPWSPRKSRGRRASVDARKPLRRSQDLITEAVGDELLVYDRISKRAHCLSATAARVWQACDGRSDRAAISAELGLPLEVVRDSFDELEAAELLDPGLELIDVGSGNGNGRAVTRRELGVRSAKVGAAVATAPLILSITAPTAMAAVTPSFDACAVSTGNSCGNNPGQCGFISGCCCCCNWQSGGQCQLCTPLGLCNTNGGNCPNPYPLNGGLRASCNSGLTGTAPPPSAGCCGASAATVGNCGCAFSPVGRAGNANPTPANAGLANGGPGCCTPGATSGSGTACTQGSAGCVPCCNGDPIPNAGMNARPGCCPTAATGSGHCGIA